MKNSHITTIKSLSWHEIFAIFIIFINILIIFYWHQSGLLNPSYKTILLNATIKNRPSLCAMATLPLDCLKDLSNKFTVEDLWNRKTWSHVSEKQASVIINSSKECLKLSGDLFVVCDCYKNSSCNKEICSKIQSNNIKNECLLEAASFTKDSSICSLFETKKPYDFVWLQEKCTNAVK